MFTPWVTDKEDVFDTDNENWKLQQYDIIHFVIYHI